MKERYGKKLSDLVIKYSAESVRMDKEENELLFKSYETEWFTICNNGNRAEKGVIELDKTAFARMVASHQKKLQKHFKPKRTLLERIFGA